MHRIGVFLLAFCLLGSGASVSCRGAVKSYDDLSAMQIAALQESEGRLVQDDRVLEALQSDLLHRQISRRDFAVQEREVVACIGDEAAFQNSVLRKQSDFPAKSQAVLRTIGKYSVEIPLAVLMAFLRAGGNYSP
jgi:hypothetical protein